MIRWHRIKYRVAADAWHHATGRGTIVVVDCGKGLPPAIDSLVTITTESDGIAGVWRVRGIEIGGMGTRVGLVVIPATAEDRETAGTDMTWRGGPFGMPTDRDVWVYAYGYGMEDDVSLLRGRYDPDFDEFREVESKRLVTAKILCWADREERPVFSLGTVKAIVAGFPVLVDRDDEIAHVAEDWLHRESLRAVAMGHPDARAIAAAALESCAVKFTRYYS